MKPNKPKTLEETLAAVHEAAEDSNILDEVLAMKSEQVDAELAKAGIDVDALDQRLAAREAEVRKSQEDEPPRSGLRMVSQRLAALVATGTLFVGGAGGYTVEALNVASRMAQTTLHAAAPRPELRDKAFQACGRGHWRECLDELDRAKVVDPDGDAEPEVQQARVRAEQALHR